MGLMVSVTVGEQHLASGHVITACWGKLWHEQQGPVMKYVLSSERGKFEAAATPADLKGTGVGLEVGIAERRVWWEARHFLQL